MAAMINFICIVFFLSLVGKGTFQCTTDDLVITQAKSGKLVDNKPEWNVTVTNKCVCLQLNVNIGCKGFKSVEKIDPFLVSIYGDRCLINNGAPIDEYTPFNFVYAWNEAYPFKVLSSQIQCS